MLLKHILYLSKELRVSEVARDLRLSKGLVSKYFEILAKEYILRKIGTRFLVENNANVRGLKILLNVEKVKPALFKKHKFVRAAGLYGSCARGTNTSDSDIDVWVKVENADDERVIDLSNELRKRIKGVSVLILDDTKLNLLKEKDPLFYHSLYFGSILIFGKENEI